MNAMLQRGDGSGAGAHPDLVRAKETRMRAFIIAAALLVLSPTAPAQDAAPPPARRAQERDDFAAGNEAFQKEDWEGAVKAYQAALAKGSGMRLIHFRLGYSLHMLKRYEEALKHHLLATQLTNRALRIDALYNVACAQALLGRKDEALKFLQYAIDAGFKDTVRSVRTRTSMLCAAMSDSRSWLRGLERRRGWISSLIGSSGRGRARTRMGK
jgi:tetratricopeptide (TPR) repeat protein